ncbi:uncharacterized protein T551_02069 [Pneumocystis jirovecii RU7]|uniref:Dienelactone hydrolase domain-containing protein n=1 Tax=Pneumocystis jirovecii (strain RU7) TaxID=1408657 RepID=A0A0W4ZM43_PNEJ7|nr:uncharacterized protein T551_02069 [Pneumocystis jirovecii RU7]KTW29453.1 hypothetical protein T551_02069 [Pneumocystis jirovecii RU7]
MSLSNTACCSLLPVVSDYTPKGYMTKISNIDAYVIGDNKERTLICIYDIFGYWPQTKQCADLLSAGLGDARIVMPDFFLGNPFPLESFPPNTEEKRRALKGFFNGPANLEKNLETVGIIIENLKKDGAKSLAIFGFCWGGKLSVLSGGCYSDKINSVAMIHPAMVDSNDADNLKVPICNIISKDEPLDDCNTFEEIIRTKPFSKDCIFKTFSTMHHGFMAARSDLTNSENVEKFREGIKILISFFSNTL